MHGTANEKRVEVGGSGYDSICLLTACQSVSLGSDGSHVSVVLGKWQGILRIFPREDSIDVDACTHITITP